MTVITPTIGRIVLFLPATGEGRHADGQPFGAMIAGVNGDGTINLLVAARDGSPYGAQNIVLVQDGEEVDRDRAHAFWMAYQKGQAAKTEAATGDLAPRIAAIEDTLKGHATGDLVTRIAALEDSTSERFRETGDYIDRKFAAAAPHVDRPADLGGAPQPSPQPA